MLENDICYNFFLFSALSGSTTKYVLKRACTYDLAAALRELYVLSANYVALAARRGRSLESRSEERGDHPNSLLDYRATKRTDSE